VSKNTPFKSGSTQIIQTDQTEILYELTLEIAYLKFTLTKMTCIEMNLTWKFYSEVTFLYKKNLLDQK